MRHLSFVATLGASLFLGCVRLSSAQSTFEPEPIVIEPIEEGPPPAPCGVPDGSPGFTTGQQPCYTTGQTPGFTTGPSQGFTTGPISTPGPGFTTEPISTPPSSSPQR